MKRNWWQRMVKKEQKEQPVMATESELVSAVPAGDHKIAKKTGSLGGSTVTCECGWESEKVPSTARAVALWTEHATS